MTDAATPLAIHPIVGCGALPQVEREQDDGRWLLVTSDWALIDPAQWPALAEVSPSVRFGALVLRAPGMLRLDVPLDVIEDDPSVWHTLPALAGATQTVVDEGELAGAWFSDYLGTPVRLVKRLYPAEMLAAGA